MGEYVASLTTISTSHNGSVTMDKLMRLPKIFLKIGSKATDFINKIGGDKCPDTYRCLEQLTTSYMAEFNKGNPDYEGVYYRSYSFEMNGFSSDFIMAIPYLAVKLLNGRSDGLLTSDETAWGDYKGTFKAVGRRGISHADEVDLRRRPFSKKAPMSKNEISDITDFYADIVSELKGMGF